MALFNRKQKENTAAITPMDMLFRSFILDTIGELPAQQSAALEALDLGTALKIDADDWRVVIKEALHLSPTIEIAIQDLWYTNGDKATQRGTSYPATAFAADFVANFYKENSQVDVWGEGDLERAKARIGERKFRK